MRFGRVFLVAAALAGTGLGCVGSTTLDVEGFVGGTSREPIINGTAATGYPEAALIDMNGYACSGSLIAPRVVLTAGHCVQGMSSWKVTLPFARNQTAKATGATVLDYKDQTDYVNPDQHDVGLVFLGTSLTLDAWPVIAQKPVAFGSRAINIGRIQNGKLSNSQLFQSQPIAMKDGASEGFPFDYYSNEVIESGDSGGPVIAASSSPHSIIAVNSGGGSGTEVLARTDLVYTWIDEQVRAHGGWGTNAGSSSGGAVSSSSSGAASSSSSGAASSSGGSSSSSGASGSSSGGRSSSSSSGATSSSGGTSSSGATSSSGGTSSSGATSSSSGSTPGACTPEVEPDDSFQSARPLAGSVCGTLSTSDVFDWYTWTIDGAKKYAIRLDAQGDAQVLMWKRVDGGYAMVANTTATSIEHTASGAGTYYVLVLSFGATPQSYELSLSGGSASAAAPSGGSSGSATVDGAALYRDKCARCHGALATSTKRGTTAARIVAKHRTMVTSAEATAIANALQ
jgi:mono/diheme cytochrome c family protein